MLWYYVHIGLCINCAPHYISQQHEVAKQSHSGTLNEFACSSWKWVIAKHNIVTTYTYMPLLTHSLPVGVWMTIQHETHHLLGWRKPQMLSSSQLLVCLAWENITITTAAYCSYPYCYCSLCAPGIEHSQHFRHVWSVHATDSDKIDLCSAVSVMQADVTCTSFLLESFSLSSCAVSKKLVQKYTLAPIMKFACSLKSGL